MTDWRDEDVLEELYHKKSMSVRDVADELGCGQTTVIRWMDRYDISRRDRAEVIKRTYAGFRTKPDGYEYWYVQEGEHQVQVHVAHLVAIADGVDPQKLFGNGHHIHHKNHIKWDNRADNLELLTHSQHSALHAEGRNSGGKWRDERILEDLYVNECLSLREIADRLDCGVATVDRWVSKFGLERPDEYQPHGWSK